MKNKYYKKSYISISKKSISKKMKIAQIKRENKEDNLANLMPNYKKLKKKKSLIIKLIIKIIKEKRLKT